MPSSHEDVQNLSRIACRHRTRAVRIRIHLLPPGEGGRYGRMRGPGRTLSHALRREADRTRIPSSAPSGHLLPGGEGEDAPHHRQGPGRRGTSQAAARERRRHQEPTPIREIAEAMTTTEGSGTAAVWR